MKKKIIVLLLTLSIVSCTLVAGFQATASYQSEIEELERKSSEVRSQIDSVKNDISKQEELRSALQQQIDILQEQIDIYNGQITVLNNKILALNEDKAVFEKDFNEKKSTFLKRVRAMYISGSTDNELSVLLGAENFGDYLYHSELLDRVTASDNQMMDELKKDIAEIEKIEAEVQVQVDQITPLQNSVVSKQNELNDTMKEYNAIIADLEGKQADLEMTLSEYEAQKAELEAAIQADIAAANSARSEGSYDPTEYSTGQFTWPCPGYYYLSSVFGYRTDPWQEYHSGMDIAGSGIYGQPIIAADGGTVIVAGDYYGYGIAVMIDHGNGLVSLYGHMSDAAVGYGQNVSRGQTIGYVGSTGWSTGPHLHFEVRQDGVAVDPQNYL